MSDRLLVSTRKGLFAVDRTTAGWRVSPPAFLGDNVTLAHSDPQGGWFAALNLGHFGVKLKFSPDGGKTWEDRPAPAYPEGEIITLADGKPPFEATLKLIWALESGGADQPGRLWAGTAPGGLFKSDDSGQTWELVRGLWDRPERKNFFGGGYDYPAIHTICRDPRSSNTIRIAISSGGVWMTQDDGATWELVGEGLHYDDSFPPEDRGKLDTQDVHQMKQCRSAPDHLWLQHHCGIFKSTDGGRKWAEVPNAKPTGFGFGVAVHPDDPNTAWFVPAVKDQYRIPVDGKLVVSRTRDGGETFEVLRDGLPQENAYDLVYRHALALDATGDRLAIGSTTGGLWVSENQGDRWQEVSAHLPPIHAVTFAA